MSNISKFKDCYGCGVCAAICPKKIISLSLNEDGFYQPFITDAAKCVDCGLCLNVCSFQHDDLALTKLNVKSYAAWSNNLNVRIKSSSGGVGFELGRLLIDQGYKVCGVKYNAERQRAEHYIATTIEELVHSSGSKYIQSYTLEGFKEINKKERYLVTGTPCQIDSFRRLIQKQRIEENFVLLDFFCHGVPSMNIWHKYIKHVEKITGTITRVSWRTKLLEEYDYAAMDSHCKNKAGKVDWHDSYNMLLRGEKSCFNLRRSQGDLFYIFFLGNLCLGKACYNHCKFKYNHSSADIRIGDLWGTKYQDNKDGVSAVITFTSKGNDVLKQCNCTLVEHPFEVVAEGQIKDKVTKPLVYPIVTFLLKKGQPLDGIAFKTILFLNKVFCKIKSFLP